MGSVSQQGIMFCCNPSEQNQTMAGSLAMIWAWLRNKALGLTDLYSDCLLMCSTANILHDGEVLSLKAFLKVWGKGGGGSSGMFPLKCYSYIDRSLRRQWKGKDSCWDVERPLFPWNYSNLYISFRGLPHIHILLTNWQAHAVWQMYRSSFIVVGRSFCTYTEPTGMDACFDGE